MSIRDVTDMWIWGVGGGAGGGLRCCEHRHCAFVSEGNRKLGAGRKRKAGFGLGFRAPFKVTAAGSGGLIS